jgi:hypothetical protein
MSKLLNLSLLLCLFTSCETIPSNQKETYKQVTSEISTDHIFLGEKNAREQVNNAVKNEYQKYTFDTLINNYVTAIAIAEPILFNTFGKEQILEERPYEVYLIDGYWYIAGTIPKGWKGGGFEIIFSALDGKIIKLTHYK